jgi:predicted nucleic acid-binding protein
MQKYLIDSDAWLALRKLSVLELMLGATTLPRPLLICEYAARHELSSISDELSALERQTHLCVCNVREKTKKQHIRSLIKEGTDKGEAEAVVWSLAQDKDCRPRFVSVDREARRTARENGLTAGDVFDLVVDLLEEDVLNSAEVQQKLFAWEDRRQQLGRPSDFTDFPLTLQKRRCARWSG